MKKKYDKIAQEGRREHASDNEEILLTESIDPMCGAHIEKILLPKENAIIKHMFVCDPVIPIDYPIPKYRGIVIWSHDIPITTQIVAIKKILKKYVDVSNQELLNIARSNSNLIFGEIYGSEADEILDLARKYNLNIEMVDVETGEKLEISF